MRINFLLLTSISAPGVEKFLKGGFRLWMNSKNLCSLLRSHATYKTTAREWEKKVYLSTAPSEGNYVCLSIHGNMKFKIEN